MHEVRFVLERRQELVIGRADDCDVVLVDPLVSHCHAAISVDRDMVWIRDLGSLNGTILNGTAIRTPVRLRDQDEIHLGATRLIFRTPPRTSVPKRRQGSTIRLPLPTEPLPKLAQPSHEDTQAFNVAELDQLLRTAPSSFGQERANTSRRLRCLYRMGYDLIAIPDLVMLLERLVEIVNQALDADRVIFIDRKGVVRAAQIKDAVQPGEPPYQQGMVGQALELGQVVQSRDLPEPTDSTRPEPAHSAVAWPVSGPKGGTYGVLYAANGATRPAFSPEDARFGGAVAGMAGAVLANLAMLKKLERARNEVEARTLALQQKHQEVVQLNRFKDELLSMAAHDLRTPLTSILGTLDLAQMAVERGAAADGLADLELARNEVCRMTELLADLLDHQRIEAGRVQVNPQQIDARPMLERFIGALMPVARQRGRHLSLDVRANTLYADPLRLKQIMENLLSNALRYTHEGAHIWVEAEDSNGGVTVTVRDNGPGISEEDRERIFAAFVRGEEAPKGQGSGLGLAIVRKLVDLHNGRIDVGTNPGGGALFQIYLPNEEATGAGPAESSPRMDLRSTIEGRVEAEIRSKLEQVEAHLRHRLEAEIRPQVEAELRAALEEELKQRRMPHQRPSEEVAPSDPDPAPGPGTEGAAPPPAGLCEPAEEPPPEPVNHLKRLPGVGSRKARTLCDEGFDSVEKIATARLEELERCPGLGRRSARKLQEHARRLCNT